jgi:hypothetical protein
MFELRLAAAGVVCVAMIVGYASTDKVNSKVASASSATSTHAPNGAHMQRAITPPHWILPDKQLTPGAVRTTNVSEICSHGTRELRHWSRERDDHVLQRYGLADRHIREGVRGSQDIRRADFQIDHLVPLGIGGADDDNNLWPQPYPDAEAKDRLEWRMRDLVCKQNYPVTQLQDEIKRDWVRAYKKYVGE